jgi:hypothetical protein
LTPVGLLGCGATPRQAEPETARATLRRALDAWQNGASPEAFQGASPTVTIVESRWQQGIRLLRYELNSDGTPSGFDVQFAVKLSLQDRAGKKFQEKALYNISTSPVLVIVRSDGAG